MTGSVPPGDVDFLDDGALRPPYQPLPARTRPRWLVPVLVVACAALVAVALGTRHTVTPARARVAAATGRAAATCPGCTVRDEPGPQLIAAVALHLPGAVLTREQTTTARRGARVVLVRRTATIVYGNVTMSVTVAPRVAGVITSPTGTAFEHGAWRVAFLVAGYYAPPASTLETLADEPALLAPSG